MESIESPADVERLLRAVHALDPDTDGPQRLAWIRELSALANAVDAAIASLVAEHHLAEHARQNHLPESDRARHVPTEIALVRGISRSAAERESSSSVRLVHRLPQTMAAWRAGVITTRAARATSAGARHLTAAQCRLLDQQLAPQLPLLKPATVAHRVEALVNELDPDGALARGRAEESERRVTLRSAGNGMAYLSVYDTVARVTAEMKTLKGAHEQRQLGAAPVPGKGACYADTVFQRLTGCTDPTMIPIRVHVVMSADSLLGHTDHAATVGEPGSDVSLPAEQVRQWIRANRADPEFVRWLTDPSGEFITATERAGRYYTGHLRRFITTRDRLCRGPNCSSPITEIDHARRWADGGATTAHNAQGLCQACNLAKESMTVTAVPPRRSGGPPGHRWTTPNGLTYDSHPPPPAGDPIRHREWRLDQAIRTMPDRFGKTHTGRTEPPGNRPALLLTNSLPSASVSRRART